MRLREQNARSKRAARNIVAKRTRNPHAKANPIIGWQVATGNEVSLVGQKCRWWGTGGARWRSKRRLLLEGKKTADLSTALRFGRDDNSVVWSILGLPSHWKHYPSRITELSSRPVWSLACAPPKVMKNALCPATALHGSVALPFVIPTEAKRSGGICSSADLSWKCFRPERSAVERSAVFFA
jgi:hypothetical protein